MAKGAGNCMKVSTSMSKKGDTTIKIGGKKTPSSGKSGGGTKIV